MSPKSWVLVGAAVAVFAAAVYLFIQVKSSTAQAQAEAPADTIIAGRPSPSAERSTEPTPARPSSPSATEPSGTVPAKGRVATDVAAGTQAMTASPALEEGDRANPKLDSLMELANKAYDRQDFDEAIAVAGKVLAKDPSNVRMLRVMVSANCIGGDASLAQQYYQKLPAGSPDREQMKTRCDRYQVSLKD